MLVYIAKRKWCIMQSYELDFIYSILDTVKNKITNVQIQQYIIESISKHLNDNSIINDLTTGIEIYKESDNGTIEDYFKILFYPINNDFNFKKFKKIEIVSTSGKAETDKMTIEFMGNLIEVTENKYKCEKANDKVNFITTQNIFKKQYLKNDLVYIYNFLSVISSDFLVPSYDIEEETWVSDKYSTTKSVIVFPKYTSTSGIKNLIKKTDSIIGRYLLDNNEINNITFINSTDFVGEKFNDKKDNKIVEDYANFYKASNKNIYEKVQQQLSKKYKDQ